MMYTNKHIDSPQFGIRMEDYNSLVNSIDIEGDYVARIGLAIRTTNTNKIIKNGDSVLFDIEINPFQNKGYFSLIHSIRHFLMTTFGEDEIPSLIPQTVLMPVGAFMYNNEMIFYFNLIVEDEIEENFVVEGLKSTSLLELGNLDDKSKVVLSTLPITKTK